MVSLTLRGRPAGVIYNLRFAVSFNHQFSKSLDESLRTTLEARVGEVVYNTTGKPLSSTQLQDLLAGALDMLRVGGRLVVISFHSLEDRMVKRYMRDMSRGDKIPPGVPVTESALNRRMRLVGKAVKASAGEVDANVRARSAIMRVAEKIA